jgi:hypothetical protein
MTGCKNSSVFETVLDVVGTMGSAGAPDADSPGADVCGGGLEN